VIFLYGCKSGIPMPDVDAGQRFSRPVIRWFIMKTDDLDFQLPAELIAQAPTDRREASRLLHYRRSDRTIAHRVFSDLPELMREGDLLVFNDAKVTPARFALRKDTGGRVEGLFVGEVSPGRWSVLLKNAGPVDSHRRFHFVGAEQTQARIVEKKDDEYVIDVATDLPALVLLSRIGRMPLPPYIKREKERDPRDEFDRQRYQTVYARAEGSVAAPTAGLHFTQEILNRLDSKGVQRVFVTLHVGLGTFKPVTAAILENHAMHTEAYTIPPDTAAAIDCAKREHRRIIAVGTTSARVLESQSAGAIEPVSGETAIFIYPPYQWRHVDALITNFHLPRSTLIALVAAWVGMDEQRRIYAEAIAERYRFFSYCDASFLE
jgi:S-adenosylmethionine:tRNA ribosyltransferase-isomerase